MLKEKKTLSTGMIENERGKEGANFNSQSLTSSKKRGWNSRGKRKGILRKRLAQEQGKNVSPHPNKKMMPLSRKKKKWEYPVERGGVESLKKVSVPWGNLQRHQPGG